MSLQVACMKVSSQSISMPIYLRAFSITNALLSTVVDSIQTSEPIEHVRDESDDTVLEVPPPLVLAPIPTSSPGRRNKDLAEILFGSADAEPVPSLPDPEPEPEPKPELGPGPGLGLQPIPQEDQDQSLEAEKEKPVIPDFSKFDDVVPPPISVSDHGVDETPQHIHSSDRFSSRFICSRCVCQRLDTQSRRLWSRHTFTHSFATEGFRCCWQTASRICHCRQRLTGRRCSIRDGPAHVNGSEWRP